MLQQGAASFASLLSGTAGVSYLSKEFVKIMPNYVQHRGLRSYDADAEIGLCHSRMKNLARIVSINVRDPLEPPEKLKLKAGGVTWEAGD